jgi:hypothetical protein
LTIYFPFRRCHSVRKALAMVAFAVFILSQVRVMFFSTMLLHARNGRDGRLRRFHSLAGALHDVLALPMRTRIDHDGRLCAVSLSQVRC